jgi:hypothetical protein
LGAAADLDLDFLVLPRVGLQDRALQVSQPFRPVRRHDNAVAQPNLDILALVEVRGPVAPTNSANSSRVPAPLTTLGNAVRIAEWLQMTSWPAGGRS